MQFFIIWGLLYFGVRYYSMGVTRLAHKLISRDKWKSHKINVGDTPWKNDLEKVKSGLLIGSIFRTGLLAGLFCLPENWVPIYYNISDHGWFFLIGTVILYSFYFDLWFYVSHRYIFHIPKMYKHSHLTHHLFKDPVVPVRNAFSISEMIITTVGGYAILLVVPFHPVAILIGREIFVQFVNVYNHLGYEIMPRGFTKHYLFKYLTTPTHHTMHHMYNNCNFSLLINYDYIFKTQHKKYDQMFDAIHDRIEANPVQDDKPAKILVS